MANAAYLTFYLRDFAASLSGSTAPSGLFGAADYSNAAAIGANVRLMDSNAVNAGLNYTATGSLAAGVPRKYALAQFASPLLAAQSIGAGNWTVALTTRASNADVTSQKLRAAIYLINGATGAIRTTIVASIQIGATKTTTTTYTTCYDAAVAGAAATATAGDYILLEIITEADKTGATGSRDLTMRTNYTTDITADNVTNATPRSLIAAPADLTLQSTDLYLLSAASDINPGAEDERLLGSARGGGSATHDTTATAGGTSIQETASAGGTAITWISPPLNAATIVGPIALNRRGKQSASTVNVSRRVLIERCDGAGAHISDIVPLTTQTSNEYSTSEGQPPAWSIVPTTTTLAGGDRIKVTFYLGNFGTMGAGTVTHSINGATAGAVGDSWLRFTELIAEYIPTYTLSGSGTGQAATGSGAGLAFTAPVYTLSGSGTGQAPTGTGTGLAFTAPTYTLSGSGTGAAPSGSDVGLAFTPPTYSLSGAGTGQAATGTGTGLAFTPPDYTLSGAGTGEPASGGGVGLTFSAPVYSLSGSGTGESATGSGAGLLFSPPTYTLSGAGTGEVASGSGIGLTFTAPTYTLSGSGTGQEATGAGAGLAFTPPTYSLSGSGTGASATGGGIGLVFAAPVYSLSGSGVGEAATGSGVGLTFVAAVAAAPVALLLAVARPLAFGTALRPMHLATTARLLTLAGVTRPTTLAAQARPTTFEGVLP